MKYIPVILLVFMLILPALTLLTLRKEIGLKQTREGKLAFISDKEDFRFSFISPKKNLNSVVLKLKNTTVRSSVGRNSKPIYFKLLKNQSVLSQIQINGSNIIEDSDIRFTFPAIEDSENEIFTVILNSPETNKDEELGINMDTSNNPVIITYHIPTSKLHLMLDVYKNLLGRILEDKVFLVTWLILFGSIVLIIKSADI